jgi:hypothetical protein
LWASHPDGDAWHDKWYATTLDDTAAVAVDKWTQAETFDVGALSVGDYRWWIAAWNAETATLVWSDRGDFSVP